MYSTAGFRSSKALLMGGSMLAAMVLLAPSAASAQEGVEAVTVTGYAASLEKATDVYLRERADGERFVDTYRRIGMEPFKEAIYG